MTFFFSLMSRFPITFLASSSLFNRFWSSNWFFFPSSSYLLLLIRSNTSPTSSPILRISSSLRAMVLVTSCHFSNNLCLSSCSFLNYYAVLSNYIWDAWVEVIYFSSSCCLRPTSTVNFSICRLSYLILESSYFLYFWSVTWSSSFCLPVIAHCSNYSWFQFSYSLIC